MGHLVLGLSVTKAAATLHTSLVISVCIRCPFSPLLRVEWDVSLESSPWT